MHKPSFNSARDHDGKDIEACFCDYNYQPQLTNILDNSAVQPFTKDLLNLIVLWKVDRFVFADDSLIKDLESIKRLAYGEHHEAEQTLRRLLSCSGVDIAMASTILRFCNPKTFQIIDRRAYRALYARSYVNTTVVSRKIATYFTYLDDLNHLCRTKGLDYMLIDRYLYQFDIIHNGALNGTKE